MSVSPELLERESELDLLTHALDAAMRGTGSLVLVDGEAGVGKTALLHRFLDSVDEEVRALWGSCDPLFTPRPLGPFLDVAETVGGDLLSTVQSDAKPYDVAANLVRLLASPLSPPTVLVLDDMHWADEASLDVLRLLARRIESLPVVLVVSYRSHEVGPAHALRLVIGELASSRAMHRVHVEPLSRDAVAVLAEPFGVDSSELYRKTAGNALFVTEALAAGESAIPESVRDAVLARAARLCFSAQRLLEIVSIVPQQAELWLLADIEGSAEPDIDECLGSGLLIATRNALAFRHELVRLAIEDSLRPDRRAALHTEVLEALERAPAAPVDAARLAHHAEGADDAEAVLRYAPAAARRASALGSHSEAAAQYARALRFGDRLANSDRSELLERLSYEHYLTGEFDLALETQKAALELRKLAGDPVAEADALRTLSRLLRYAGSVDEAFLTARTAVEQLEETPPGRELAMAYSNLSHLYMSVEDVESTAAWADKARALAEQLGDDEPLLYALGNVAQLAMLNREPGARERVSEIFEHARRARLDEHAGRTFVMWVWWAPRGRWYREADEHLDEGLEYCESRGLDLWRFYLLAYRARSLLDRGRWDEALETARRVIDDQRSSPMPRIVALSVLGLVRARRGDPDVWTILDEAWRLASPTGELQRIEPAVTARAEAAWLEGRPALVGADVGAALDLALLRHQDWIVGELAYWRWRAGQLDQMHQGADPYALQIAGDWESAASAWDELESPYEAALARADGDETAQRRALDELNRLGARPAAAIVARRMRKHGVRGIPRGPRETTQRNAALLTRRELDVLSLLAEGLRNAEIADRLVVSRRTVDHHVSAILRKLNARTRVEAVAAAGRLELLQDR